MIRFSLFVKSNFMSNIDNRLLIISRRKFNLRKKEDYVRCNKHYLIINLVFQISLSRPPYSKP